ncbi:MAG: type II secretion system protein N [Pseudomonadota bacterium]
MPSLKIVIPIVLVALVAGLVARFPASTALELAGVPGIDPETVSGTVWSGSLRSLDVAGKTIAPVAWQLQPAALLGGELRGDLSARAGSSVLTTALSISGAERVVVSGLTIDAELADFPEWSTVGPVGGRLIADVASATIENALPVAVTGEAALEGLTYTFDRSYQLGDYALECREPVVCDVRDTAGPLELAATLTVGADRRFVLDGRLRARPDAPVELSRLVRALGRTDAEGYYIVNLTGTIGR